MMDNNFYTSVLEQALVILETNGKSVDIATLFMNSEVPEGIISDFFIEIALTASPDEEDGAGCYSVAHLRNALQEFKQTGRTDLLNQVK